MVKIVIIFYLAIHVEDVSELIASHKATFDKGTKYINCYNFKIINRDA